MKIQKWLGFTNNKKYAELTAYFHIFSKLESPVSVLEDWDFFTIFSISGNIEIF